MNKYICSNCKSDNIEWIDDYPNSGYWECQDCGERS